jgi:hypothetical protein
MRKAVAILLLAALSVVVGCGSGTQTARGPAGPGPGMSSGAQAGAMKAEGGPKEVAQAYLKAAQAKDQATMDKYLATANQGKAFPRNLKAAQVTGDATVKGREAMVPVSMTFGNGETARTQVPLTQTAVGWKVRLGMLARSIAPKK